MEVHKSQVAPSSARQPESRRHGNDGRTRGSIELWQKSLIQQDIRAYGELTYSRWLNERLLHMFKSGGQAAVSLTPVNAYAVLDKCQRDAIESIRFYDASKYVECVKHLSHLAQNDA